MVWVLSGVGRRPAQRSRGHLYMSPRMDINPSISADSSCTPKVSPTTIHANPSLLLATFLAMPTSAMRRWCLFLDSCIVGSFHHPRLPLCQPLSVLILEGTSLSSGHTCKNVDMFSTHPLIRQSTTIQWKSGSVNTQGTPSFSHHGKGAHFLLSKLPFTTQLIM